jgi:hypothetical protein
MRVGKNGGCSVTDVQLNVWIEKKYKDQLEQWKQDEHKPGMNLIIEELIEAEMARRSRTALEEHSLPVIRELIRSEVREANAALRRELRQDRELDKHQLQIEAKANQIQLLPPEIDFDQCEQEEQVMTDQEVGTSQEEKLTMQLSDKQVTSIRRHVRSTFISLENEEFIKNSVELMLRCVEMTTFFVLADIVESLPSPVYEDVKQLLDARERLWDEFYSQSTREQINFQKYVLPIEEM